MDVDGVGFGPEGAGSSQPYWAAQDVWPVRAPRGLDAAAAVLPPEMSHGQRVELLNAPHPALGGQSPLEWLQDGGSAATVIAFVLLGPAGLVDRLRKMLGAKLAAYLAGVKDTRVLNEWIDGRSPGDTDLLLRLASACQAAALLERVAGPAIVQVWFQGRNAYLDDRSPAWMLRELPWAKSGSAVVAAARRACALPL